MKVHEAVRGTAKNAPTGRTTQAIPLRIRAAPTRPTWAWRTSRATTRQRGTAFA